MLDNGADVNDKNNKHESTPLDLAVGKSNGAAVDFLLQSDNCDVNLQVN